MVEHKSNSQVRPTLNTYQRMMIVNLTTSQELWRTENTGEGEPIWSGQSADTVR